MVSSVWWGYSLFHLLEDPVRKILGKNSDWPGLVSVAVSGPIRDLLPEEGMDLRQVQIIATNRLPSVGLHDLQGPPGWEALLWALLCFNCFVYVISFHVIIDPLREFIIPVLQMRELRHKVVKQFSNWPKR